MKPTDSMDEDEKNAIIEVASLPLDPSLRSNHKVRVRRSQNRLRNSLALDFPFGDGDSDRDTACEQFPELGTMGALPLEILHEICLHFFDLLTLWRFREVSRRARQVIRSVVECRHVVTHALSTLCAALQSCIAHWFSLHDLHKALCTRACCVCGVRFAGLIFLPSMTRCCGLCVRQAPRFQLTSLLHAVRNVENHSSPIWREFQVPMLRVKSGRYSHWAMDVYPRDLGRDLTIVAVEEVAKAFCVSQEKVTAGETEHHRWRSMATTTLPYLNMATGECQGGLLCKACVTAWLFLEHRGVHDHPLREISETAYSSADFLTHFDSCESMAPNFR